MKNNKKTYYLLTIILISGFLSFNFPKNFMVDFLKLQILSGLKDSNKNDAVAIYVKNNNKGQSDYFDYLKKVESLPINEYTNFLKTNIYILDSLKIKEPFPLFLNTSEK